METNKTVKKFMESLESEAFVEAFTANPSAALASINSEMTLDELFSHVSSEESFFSDMVAKVTSCMEQSTLSTVTSSCE